MIQDHGSVAAQTSQGRVASFADLSRVCEFRRQSSCSLYRPVALFTMADLGYLVAGVGFANAVAADTQA